MTAIHLLRRWRIRTRLLGLLTVAVLMLLAVGAAGLHGLRGTQALTINFIDKAYGTSVQSLDLGKALGDVRRYEKDMIIAYETPQKVTEYKEKWLAAVQRAGEIAQQLASSNADASANAERIQAAMNNYKAAALPVVKQLEASGYDTATVANRMLTKSKQEVHASDEAFAALTSKMREQAENTLAASQQTVNHALAVFGGSVAVAVLLMGVLTMFNVQSICGPLDEAHALADRIALGDLTVQPELVGADEAASLMAALARMQDSLRQVVGQVHTSSVSIQQASAEVAHGNSDLSQRTENAAGSLQQTASSMEELTATVRQSADAARQASELASSATQVAAHGGSVVAQVVATMEDINTSSRKIADIIGTIDGIAFQTNILALNAAVEAARAGEQGRGFAVVASEVRSLAQRSAEAAREIKTLIGASVDKVEVGTRQVADAGSTMGNIVASVRRVNDIINEISAAAAEQSSGIGQVNGAVAELDRSTQQNAALVEQGAAAAESLRDEAARLSQVVATFRLNAH